MRNPINALLSFELVSSDLLNGKFVVTVGTLAVCKVDSAERALIDLSDEVVVVADGRWG